MIVGFTTDVQGSDLRYHVRTEDRGEKHPVIESIVYIGGVIQAKRITPYVPGESTRQDIEELIRQQHQNSVESIRSGDWSPASKNQAELPPSAAGYQIRLRNGDNIRKNDHLRFDLQVLDRGQNDPVSEVALQIQWLVSGAVLEKQTAKTGLDGGAQISIPTPSDHNDATLLVCAQGPQGRALAKFYVRVADEPIP